MTDPAALIAKQYLAIDSEDAAGFAAFFTPDGIFSAPYGDFAGREAIQQFMQHHIDSGAEAGVRHYLTNFIVEKEGDAHRVRFYILKMRVRDTCGIIRTAAGDSLIEVEGGQMLIRRFKLTIDAGLPPQH